MLSTSTILRISLTTRFFAGELINDFVLSRITNGAEGLGHCARALLALEKLGSFDDERVGKIIDT